MSTKLRVAVAGAGMIANAAHIPAYRNLGDKVEIVAVADIRETAARETAERHGIPKYYTDTRKMLKEQKPDIVSICTPNAYHKELTIWALEAGAHVLCEKPIATRYIDAVEMYKTADSAGKMLFACQTMRFSNSNMAAKEITSSGKLGEVYYGEIEIIRSRGIPKWGMFHMKEHNLGGPFCDLGVHALDCLLWLAGNPTVSSVSAQTFLKLGNKDEGLITSLADSGAPVGLFTPRPYDYHEFDVEDFSAGFIKFDTGMALSFKVSWALNLPNGGSMRIAGTEGGLQLSPLKYFSNMGSYQSEVIPRVIADRSVPFSGHWMLMEHVMDVLEGREERIVKPEEVINVAKAIEGVYLSASKGREISVDELAKK